MDFVTVYIREAHPVEAEEYKTYIPKIKTHKNMTERIQAAELLKKLSPVELNDRCPVVVDYMEDHANVKYAAATGSYLRFAKWQCCL